MKRLLSMKERVETEIGDKILLVFFSKMWKIGVI